MAVDIKEMRERHLVSNGQGFRRLVTFQSSNVTNAILKYDVVETLDYVGNSMPHGVKNWEKDKSYIKMSDGSIMTFTDNESDRDKIYLLVKDRNKMQLWPFYAYEKHMNCGNLYNMSIRTIYQLASHLMGYMGYENRDIIELLVPEEYIIESRKNDNYLECLLPCIKKEWVVSILRFDDYVAEPVYGENALRYINEVYRTDTYRMCYGDDIILNGHGYGDNVEYCMSPSLLGRVDDVSIQRDYVQHNIWNLYKKYLYIVRHGLNINDIVSVDPRAATAEMPDKLNLATVHSFASCLDKLCQYTSVDVLDNSTPYSLRVKSVSSEYCEQPDDDSES